MPKPPVKPRTQLRFGLGAFEADGFKVRLSRGRLPYSTTTGLIPSQSPETSRPSEEQRHQFWQEVDRVGVWAWLPGYVNPNVLDGTQWRLELRHGERKVKSEGSNLYPGSAGIDYTADSPFAQLLCALAHLTAQPDIALIWQTAPPREGERQHNIEILNETGLATLLSEANAVFDPAVLDILHDKRKFCPKCESEMRLRTAKRGANPGRQFWGCSRYPRCHYVMQAGA